MAQAAALAGAALMTTVPGHAAGLLAFEEVGDDVVATLSGSLALDGLVPGDGLGFSGPFLNPRFTITTAPFVSGSTITYAGTTPGTFGVDRANATGVASDGITPIGILTEGGPGRATVLVSDDYVSGSPLSGTVTWADTTIADLGLTPGDYLITLTGLVEENGPSVFSASNEEPAGNTFTVRVGAAPEVIPLPAAGLLLIGGLGALAMVRRRRKG